MFHVTVNVGFHVDVNVNATVDVDIGAGGNSIQYGMSWSCLINSSNQIQLKAKYHKHGSMK